LIQAVAWLWQFRAGACKRATPIHFFTTKGKTIMANVLTNASTLSDLVSRWAVVVPTTLVQIPQKHVLAFADYLDEHELTDVFANGDTLRSSAGGGIFLDAVPMMQLAPEVYYWLRERHCPRLPGCCRVALSDKAVITDLLIDYQGNCWDAQGYTAIAASALEVSIALELRGCPTLLQLEFPFCL
jgi:hypothetical protein